MGALQIYIDVADDVDVKTQQRKRVLVARVGVKDLKIKDKDFGSKDKDFGSEEKDEEKDFGFKDKQNDKICSQTQRVANYLMHAYKVQ